ncbi:MAG: TldD/PmbA family protein [Elusimicrobia bacterium]|nr:TldD/PmbA family protein [Elusimicrobiota bacterium]
MTAPAPLLETADKALGWIKARLPKGAEAELFLSRGEERSVEMRDGRMDTLQESQDEGIGLRVLSEGRMAFAFSAGLGSAGLEHVFRQVLDQLPFIPPDEHRALPSGESTAERVAAMAPSMSDPALFVRPLEEQLPRMEGMQAAALAEDKRVKHVLRLSYGESRSEVAIVNTRGVRAIEGGSHCSAGLAAVAERGSQVQLGGGSSVGRFYSDVDFDRAARDAARRAGALLDARKPPTARRAVLFDPWVSGEFLELIAGALSADQVQRGKSLFRGKLGAAVASSRVTLVDDPWLERGIATAAFDDEGVPTRRKRMIEAGVLKEFYYDTYTARKDGRASNGTAGRASYKGTPSPSASNFYLEPGTISREALLKDTRDGILVLEVMGMHTADPVSGAFSVGLSGIAVENGELTHGVRGAMLAGNVLEILERVDGVADDLSFFTRMASPTFRVADLMVA